MSGRRNKPVLFGNDSCFSDLEESVGVAVEPEADLNIQFLVE